MGIRRSHATDVLVYFHSNPVMPTISCRKAACHTDMEDIKDDTTARDSISLHKLIQIVMNSSEGGEQTNHNRQTARSTTQMTWILNLVSINVDQLLTRNQSLCKAWQMTNGVTLSACTVRLQVHSMTKTKSTKFLKP